MSLSFLNLLVLFGTLRFFDVVPERTTQRRTPDLLRVLLGCWAAWHKVNRRCGLIIAAASRLQLERLGRVKAESILAPADEDLLPASWLA